MKKPEKMTEPVEARPVLNRKINLLFVGTVVVLLVAAGLFWYVQQKSGNSQVAAKNEVQQVVAAVGKLMQLPNEDVTIATVSDVTKLSAQPFFKYAQNGDKVLIYTASKKAILYRPSVNKIIDVGPITLTQGASSAPATTGTAEKSSTAVRTGSLQVMIFNGTTVAGLASNMKKMLTDRFTDYTFFLGDATTTYSRTKVVDLTGKNGTVAEKLAIAVNGEVTSLPPGETKPNTDILIIIGK